MTSECERCKQSIKFRVRSIGFGTGNSMCFSRMRSSTIGNEEDMYCEEEKGNCKLSLLTKELCVWTMLDTSCYNILFNIFLFILLIIPFYLLQYFKYYSYNYYIGLFYSYYMVLTALLFDSYCNLYNL